LGKVKLAPNFEFLKIQCRSRVISCIHTISKVVRKLRVAIRENDFKFITGICYSITQDFRLKDEVDRCKIIDLIISPILSIFGSHLQYLLPMHPNSKLIEKLVAAVCFLIFQCIRRPLFRANIEKLDTVFLQNISGAIKYFSTSKKVIGRNGWIYSFLHSLLHCR